MESGRTYVKKEGFSPRGVQYASYQFHFGAHSSNVGGVHSFGVNELHIYTGGKNILCYWKKKVGSYLGGTNHLKIRNITFRGDGTPYFDVFPTAPIMV